MARVRSGPHRPTGRPSRRFDMPKTATRRDPKATARDRWRSVAV